MTPHRWTDVPVDGDRRNARRSYLVANAFEAMLSLSAVVAGVGYFASPEVLDESSVGVVLGYAALAWSALYLVGGLLTVVGLFRPSIRLEVAGLIMVAGGILASATAIVALRGWTGAPTAVFYIGWAVAAAIRVWLVLRIARIGGPSA